ncbi:hypothetical protein [Tsukamurella strandjordii]|uniref:hypothetical protein n=1 Tax=Tsukamurella strandjordii TaxID=147577 RepID=UPI0031D3425F
MSDLYRVGEVPTPEQVETVFSMQRRVTGLQELIKLTLQVVDLAELLVVRATCPFGVDTTARVESGDLVWERLPKEIRALVQVKQVANVLAETLVQYGTRNLDGWFPPIRMYVEVLSGTPLNRRLFQQDIESILNKCAEIETVFTRTEGNAIFGIDFDSSFAVWNGRVVDFAGTIRPWQQDTISKFLNETNSLRQVWAGAA